MENTTLPLPYIVTSFGSSNGSSYIIFHGIYIKHYLLKYLSTFHSTPRLLTPFHSLGFV